MLIKPAPKSALPMLGQRSIALDFWRGLCLLMIFINHIPDNPLTVITMRWWGFADAAEVFVFISGVTAALALGRYFAVGGFGCGVLRVIKRVWQLFCAHVLLVFALATIIAAAGLLTDSKPMMEQLNFSPLFVETDSAIIRLARLGYMPSMTNILPLYIFFIALFPLVWLLGRVSPFLALGASAALWLWANITDTSFANYPEGVKWFFNPLAWQFLFVCGATVVNYPSAVTRIVCSNIVIGFAVIMVAFSVIAAAPWTHYQSFMHARLIPPEFLAFDNKQDLSALRVIYFAALLCLAVRFLPVQSAFWRSRVARVVALCGQHALAVYCIGAVMALSGSILLPLWQGGPVAFVAVDIVGIAVLIGIAFILQRSTNLLAATTRQLRQTTMIDGVNQPSGDKG